ncbi:MAG: helix-turn-helix domain-containing protein [Candidatus Azobacteroides sp.]|nr:helix-turn-helix domain-containing protein [Candidatus Azobacteroides sp.]
MNEMRILKIHIIFLFFSLFFSFFAYSQEITERSFIQQNSPNDFLGNSINTITQDQWGFLWIGSENGIFRFDGYSFTPLQKMGSVETENNRSFPSDFTKRIFRDSNNRIWIGMNKGMCVYDDLSFSFNYPEIFSNVFVNTFREDKNHNIWVGSDNGVSIISQDICQSHIVTTEECRELSGKRVNFISRDSKGNIWIFSEYGLHRVRIMENDSVVPVFDFSRKQTLQIESFPIKGRIGFFLIDKQDRAWICVDNKVYLTRLPEKDYFNLNEGKVILDGEECLCIVKENSPVETIWIGTRNQGIICLTMSEAGDVVSKKKYWANPLRINDLSNTTLTLHIDKWGSVWAGTQNGLFISKKVDANRFYNAKNHEWEDGMPLNVSCIYQDSKQTIWYTTDRGLNKFQWINKEENKFSIKTYTYKKTPDIVQKNKFQSIVEIRPGVFWAGTKNNIVCFDSNSNNFYEDTQLNNFLNSNGLKMVKTFYKDAKENIWMGFATGGMAVYIASSDKFILLNNIDVNLQDEDYWAIAEDARGAFWIGTRKSGLYKVKIDTDKLTENPDKAIISKQQFLSNHWITSICINKDNIPWIGTSKGAFYYNTYKGDFDAVNLSSTNDASAYVCGVLEDATDAIWIFTTQGVYKYNEYLHNTLYYDINNGNLARANYLFGHLVAKDKTIFMGGISGLNYFFPSKLIPDTTKQKIFITDFQVLNKRVLPGQNSLLSTNINLIQKLVFSHKDYQFLLEFSTLYLPDPNKIKYRYKLDGFDKDWIYVNSRHNYASYSNLPPGSYILKISSTNASGIWLDNEKNIHIKILRPPWTSWWAYCIYATLLLAIIGFGAYIVHIRSTYKQQEKNNRWKEHLYANIIQGFESPLFLLKAPMEELVGNLNTYSKPEMESLLKIMQQNVKRLLFLNKQLLELQKTDIEQASFAVSKTDLIPFLQDIYNLFSDIARLQNIRFEFQHSEDSIYAYMDMEKVEIVMYNLLSNAFKSTLENGLIAVRCYTNPNDEKIWIEIYDNGIRIEKSKGVSGLTVGAGLEISLAQSLIEAHGGILFMESIPGKGNTSRFYLHSNINNLPNKIKVNTEIQNPSSHKPYIENFIDLGKNIEITGKSEKNSASEAPRILLVEDKEDFRVFFEKILQKDGYKVRSCKTEEEVFQTSISFDPALILCNIDREDEKAAFLFCKKIKEKVQTSHIPVALLLENDPEEKNIRDGYLFGADACIFKPFEVSYLLIRIKQLIDIRHSIKEKLRIEEVIHSNKEKSSIVSIDKKFLDNIMRIIEKNIADENFNLDEFARQAGVSRSVLNTKIQALLGQAPIDFVKTVRLKKAAQLLESNAYSVSEISLMVGFVDPGYFSTSFKKLFGETPLEYVKNRKKS